MEILIVGIILVALMVFVSTKIKSSAERAFEPEIIEKEQFRIIKPKGFMSPLEGNSGFVFEARSREYGEGRELRNTRRAQAFLTVSGGLNFDAQCRNAKQSVKKVISEKVLNEANGEQKVYLLEGEKVENEASTIEFWKILQSKRQKKTYTLRISVLQPYRESYIHQVNEMTNGFRLK